MSVQMSAQTRNSIVKKALLIRRFEESLLELYKQGQMHGTVHTCIGQEFVGAVLSEHLTSDDAVFSNHRGHGHFLSMTDNVEGLFAEVLGKESGVCGGRGGSQHLHQGRYYSNGIQGSMAPVAAGVAMSCKLQNSSAIAVVFLGDGTLGEGIVYETFNIASKFSLPILFVVENNGVAQSTAIEENLAGSIRARAEAFGIETALSDTWNYEHLYLMSQDFIQRIRKSCKPGFLQVNTFRLKAHSKGDDHRSEALIKEYEQKDPLNIILSEKALEIEKFERDISERLQKSLQQALSAPTGVLSFPKAEMTLPQWHIVESSSVRCGEVLNQTFHQAMQQDASIVFLGEDVRDPYGGAFKISKNLSTSFSNRVWNMPISEAAIVGLASGLGLAGWRPVAEIMFGDFVTLAADQIVNSLSKFREMFHATMPLNVIIRTPMGGYRGYGPTHSQSLERMFLGVPGLSVIALNNLVGGQRIYNQLLKSDCGPVLCIENKIGYTQGNSLKAPEGFDVLVSDENIPDGWVRPQASHVDITIVTYGGLCDMALKVMDILFEEYDLICQLLVPTQIYPLDIQKFHEQISGAPRLVTLEEGTGFAGFGAEIVAQVARMSSSMRPEIERIHARESVIPAGRTLEEEVLPSVASITQQILNWMKK